MAGPNDATFFFDTNIEEVIARIQSGMQTILASANLPPTNPVTAQIDEQYPQRVRQLLDRTANEIGRFNDRLRTSGDPSSILDGKTLAAYYDEQFATARRANARIAAELGLPLAEARKQDKLLREHFTRFGNELLGGARNAGFSRDIVGGGITGGGSYKALDLSGAYDDARRQVEQHLSAEEREFRAQLDADRRTTQAKQQTAQAAQRQAADAQAAANQGPLRDPATGRFISRAAAGAGGRGAGGGRPPGAAGAADDDDDRLDDLIDRRKFNELDNNLTQLTDGFGDLARDILPLGNGQFANRITGELYRIADTKEGKGSVIQPGPSLEYFRAQQEFLRQTGGASEATRTLSERMRYASDLIENVGNGVRRLSPNLFEDMRSGVVEYANVTKTGAETIRRTDPAFRRAETLAAGQDLQAERRGALGGLFSAPGVLAEGVTDLGRGYFRDIRDGTERYFRVIGDALDEITDDAYRRYRALEAESRTGKRGRGGLVGGFVHGLTSGGFGGSGIDGREGIGQAAGTTLKYTLLYSTLGLLQGALAGAASEMLNFEDSNTNLQIALESTARATDEVQGVTASYIADLERISIQAGSNVGDVMDIAAQGMRSVALDSKLSEEQLKDLGNTFALEAQKMAVLAKTDVLDAAGNMRAAMTAFDIPPDATSRINDAIVTAKNFGGAEAEIAQGLASFGSAAKNAGFTLEETAAIVSRVQAATDQSGEAVGNKLARLASIVSGSGGQGAIATINAQLDEADRIDLGGTTATQLKQLAGAWDGLGTAQRKYLTNRLGGETASREVAILLRDLNEVIDNQGEGLNHAGSAAEEYERRLHDLTQTVRELQGSLKAIVVNLSTSGLLDPLIIAFEALAEAAKSLAFLTGMFNEIHGASRHVVITLLEIAAALALIGKISKSEAGLKGFILGAEEIIAPTRTAARKNIAGGVAEAGAEAVGAAAAAKSGAKVAEEVASEAAGSAATQAAAKAAATKAAADAVGSAAVEGAVKVAATEAAEEAAEAAARSGVIAAAAGAAGAAGAGRRAGGEAAAGAAGASLLTRGKGLLGSIGSGAASVGRFATNPYVALTALVVGTGALIARAGELSDTMDKTTKTLKGNLGDIYELPGDQQADALRNEVSKLRTQREDLVRQRSGIGRITAGPEVYDRIDTLGIKADYLERQAEAVERETTKVAEGLSKMTVFGDPATLTAERLSTGLDALASSGVSAAQRMQLLTAAIGGLPGSAAAQEVNKPAVARSATESILGLQTKHPEIFDLNAKRYLGQGQVEDDFFMRDFFTNIAPQLQSSFVKSLPDSVKNPDGTLDPKQLQSVQDEFIKFVMPYYQNYISTLGQAAQDMAPTTDQIAELLRGGIAEHFAGRSVTFGGPADAPLNSEQLTSQLAVVLQASSAQEQALVPGDNDALLKVLKDRQKAIQLLINRGKEGGAELGVAIAERAKNDARIAEVEIASMEETRKALQNRETDTKKIEAIGQQYHTAEVEAAIRGGNIAALKDIINNGNKIQLAITRQALVATVDLAQFAVDAAAKQLVIVAAVSGVFGPAFAAAAAAYAAASGALDEAKKGLGLYDKAASQSAPPATGGRYAGEDAQKAREDEKREAEEKRRAQLELRIAKRNARALPDAQLDAARRAIRDSNERLAILDKNSQDYYDELARNVQAKRDVADAERQHAANMALLAIDITNPVQVARVERDNARRELNAAKGRADRAGLTGDERADYLFQYQQDATSKDLAYQNTVQSEFMNNLQTAERLGRISHRQYIEYLEAERDRTASRLKGMKKTDDGYYQTREYLKQIDESLKSATDEMQGQFNIGDIDVPTPYEVRRAIKARSGGSILTNNQSFSTSGNVVNDTSTTNLVFNGVPLNQLIAIVQEMTGGRRTRTTSAKRKTP